MVWTVSQVNTVPAGHRVASRNSSKVGWFSGAGKVVWGWNPVGHEPFLLIKRYFQYFQNFCNESMSPKRSVTNTLEQRLENSDIADIKATPSGRHRRQVRSTLRQFVRDWAKEGQAERMASYNPLISALLKHLPPKGLDVSDVSCGERTGFKKW